MNKTFLTFVAAPAAMPLALFSVFLLMSASIGALPYKAHAYAVGPVPPSAGGSSSATGQGPAAPIGQGYNFPDSFSNLVSSFTSFFNNIRSSSGNLSIGGNSAGIAIGTAAGNGMMPAVAATVNWQSYLNGFNEWFYNATGVRIDGFTNFIVHFFGWLFGWLQGIAVWIAGAATRSIKQ